MAKMAWRIVSGNVGQALVTSSRAWSGGAVTAWHWWSVFTCGFRGDAYPCFLLCSQMVRHFGT